MDPDGTAGTFACLDKESLRQSLYAWGDWSHVACRGLTEIYNATGKQAAFDLNDIAHNTLLFSPSTRTSYVHHPGQHRQRHGRPERPPGILCISRRRYGDALLALQVARHERHLC